jgi:hypothetical protein
MLIEKPLQSGMAEFADLVVLILCLHGHVVLGLCVPYTSIWVVDPFLYVFEVGLMSSRVVEVVSRWNSYTVKAPSLQVVAYVFCSM